MRRSEEVQEALARRDAARATERAKLASRPSNNWIEVDRFKLEATADDAPKPVKEKRGRGRPPKVQP